MAKTSIEQKMKSQTGKTGGMLSGDNGETIGINPVKPLPKATRPAGSAKIVSGVGRKLSNRNDRKYGTTDKLMTSTANSTVKKVTAKAGGAADGGALTKGRNTAVKVDRGALTKTGTNKIKPVTGPSIMHGSTASVKPTGAKVTKKKVY